MHAKAPYAILLILQLINLAVLAAGGVSIEAFYYLSMLWLVVLIWFAYLGIFPFNDKSQIVSKIGWYSSGLISALGVVILGNSGERLFWYPTEHSFWVLVPYLALGAVCWKFGLAMKPAD